MRKLLLLLGLAMTGALVFSTAAWAQGVSCEGFTTTSGEPSQFEAQQFFDFRATEEEQAILDPDGNGFACDGGEIEFGSSATPTASPTANPSATPTATASASTSAADAAQYQYTSALPGTGGVAPVTLLAIIPAILLLGGGLLSARLIRRS